MKILFIGDALESLKPQSDTSLVLARQALVRQHAVYWATDFDLEYYSDRPRVKAKKIEKLGEGRLPELGAAEVFDLTRFHSILIRKDPPFDLSYVKLCWLLSLVESKVWMLNPASILLRYHEKLIPLQAVAEGYLSKRDIIPTHIGNLEGAKEFVTEFNLKKVIQKPFLGYGGKGVRLLDARDLTASEQQELIQPFKVEISQGDSRVFFLNGKVVGHFTRVPKEGDFISNLAQGGTAQRSKLKSSQFKVLERLGKFLKRAKIVFAGADLIGNCISEVNITSPTGLVALKQLENIDLSESIIAFVERSVRARIR